MVKVNTKTSSLVTEPFKALVHKNGQNSFYLSDTFIRFFENNFYAHFILANSNPLGLPIGKKIPGFSGLGE